MEKPISTSTGDIPEALKDFVHQSVQSMDEKKLRTWKRDSNKIIRKAKRRAVKGRIYA